MSHKWARLEGFSSVSGFSFWNFYWAKSPDVNKYISILKVNQVINFFSSFLFLAGESVDKTGSYDDAIFASIGIYVAATALFLLVPFYQRCFAPDRYIMARTKPKSVNEIEAMGPFETWIFLPPAIESTVHLDFESSVWTQPTPIDSLTSWCTTSLKAW